MPGWWWSMLGLVLGVGMGTLFASTYEVALWMPSPTIP